MRQKSVVYRYFDESDASIDMRINDRVNEYAEAGYILDHISSVAILVDNWVRRYTLYFKEEKAV